MSARSQSPQKPTPFKQGTLNFASVKRTGSSAAAKNSLTIPKTNSRDSAAKEQPVRPEKESGSSSAAEPNTIEGRNQVQNLAPVPLLVGAQGDGKATTAGQLPAKAELLENDPRWKNHYAIVKKKMGNAKAIHGDGQGMVHDILRVFDLSYEYGPCVGITRLERWERASTLGLNPPREVFDILSTRQGNEKPELMNPVFHDEV